MLDAELDDLAGPEKARQRRRLGKGQGLVAPAALDEVIAARARGQRDGTPADLAADAVEEPSTLLAHKLQVEDLRRMDCWRKASSCRPRGRKALPLQSLNYISL